MWTNECSAAALSVDKPKPSAEQAIVDFGGPTGYERNRSEGAALISVHHPLSLLRKPQWQIAIG